MIRQVWIVECDLCGRTEEAKCAFKRQLGNATDYTLPDGWGYGHNKDFTLCPDCLARNKPKAGENI